VCDGVTPVAIAPAECVVSRGNGRAASLLACAAVRSLPAEPLGARQLRRPQAKRSYDVPIELGK